MSWTWTSSPLAGVHQLHRADKHVASIWWFHEPQHTSVVMTRIVDRLNLPAAECAPSPDPTWALALVPCNETSIPAAWGTFSLDQVEVMACVWEIMPARLANWHQRILDALNVGRGLPAVSIPNLPRSAAA